MTSPKTLISYDETTKKFKCHGDVLMDMSLSFKAKREGYSKLPVAIVSIAGDTRTGKSFLLNFFLRESKRFSQGNWSDYPDEPLEGFAWEHGVHCVTKGIVVWPEPFIARGEYGQKIAVILMDTQGLNDDETSVDVNKQLFGLSMLLSSVQIYNLKSQIQSNDIVNLAELCKFGKSVYTRTDSRFKASGSLVFLIRDWKNPSEHNYGSSGGLRYLRRKRLNQQNQFSQQWKLLDDCYSNQECFLMPSPGENCSSEYRGEICRLKPAFFSNVMDFTHLSLWPGIIETKSWIGDELSLWEYTDFFKKVASHLEEYQCIRIDRLLDSFEEAQSTDALASATELYVKLAFKELHERKNKSTDQVLEMCQKKAWDHFEQKARFIGSNRMQKSIKLMKFFETFSIEYKAGNKDKEWWQRAFKVGGNLALTIGFSLLFNRLKLAGMGFRLLKVLVTRS